ncbi:MAG: hypothetical protein L3J92_05105 [Thermoplasmata archaeon]|nr:hypothetical protein [Thermoplasmata archaeon]
METTVRSETSVAQRTKIYWAAAGSGTVAEVDALFAQLESKRGGLHAAYLKTGPRPLKVSLETP